MINNSRENHCPWEELRCCLMEALSWPVQGDGDLGLPSTSMGPQDRSAQHERGWAGGRGALGGSCGWPPGPLLS